MKRNYVHISLLLLLLAFVAMAGFSAFTHKELPEVIAPLGGNVAEASTIVRGWNHDIEVEPTGVHHATFRPRWVNYENETGTFTPIDLTPKATGAGWEIRDNIFYFSFPQYADEPATFINNNRFNAVELRDINEIPFSFSITAKGTDHAPGRLETGVLTLAEGLPQEYSYIVYPDAWPGADLIYVATFKTSPVLQKLIRFNAKPAVFDYTFAFKSPDVPKITYDGAAVTKKTLNKIGGDLAFTFATATTDRKTDITDVSIWDSGSSTDPLWKRNIGLVPYDLNIVGGALELTKKLPSAFFDTAVYPVFTDTVINAANVDGATNGLTRSAASFAANHDATTGTVSGGYGPGLYYLSGTYYMERWQTSFDTSAIGAGAVVSSSTMLMRWGEIYYGIDGNDKLQMVQSYGNDTTIGTTDYEDIGSDNDSPARAKYTPIKLLSDTEPDISTITGGSCFSTATGWVTWLLNANGRTYINPTGKTNTGLRLKPDTTNTDPGTAGWCNWMRANWYTGGATDPYLLIDYTIPAASATSTSIVGTNTSIIGTTGAIIGH